MKAPSKPFWGDRGSKLRLLSGGIDSGTPAAGRSAFANARAEDGIWSSAWRGVCAGMIEDDAGFSAPGVKAAIDAPLGFSAELQVNHGLFGFKKLQASKK